MTYQESKGFQSSLKNLHVREEDLNNELTKAPSASSFGGILEGELSRIPRFVNEQQITMELYAKGLFSKAHAMATGSIGASAQEGYDRLNQLRQATKQTVEDYIALQEFYSTSRATLLRVAAMADEKWRSQSSNFITLVQERVRRAHLNSSTVCVVSDIYDALRQAEEKIKTQDTSNGVPMWQAPSSFERSTTKYWVRDENLTKLMMICAAEAPLLIYGKTGPLTSTDRNDLQKSSGDLLWDTLATKITSIYFDSNDMALYEERLKRSEGAQLLRARWYGPKMPTGEKIIFLELKTHHEKWVGNKSVKERALVRECDMIKFLEPVMWTKEDAKEMIMLAKPNMKTEEIPKATNLLLRMHNLVVKHRLTACVRSVYDRAAFQSAKSNDLRLTLDRNVTLVNERVHRSTSSRAQWCLTDTEAVTAPATTVPFNVFELKLASDGPMPTGLEEAQNDATLELATKFSKFTSGAAAFNKVPTLPYWATHPMFYSFFDLGSKGIPKPPTDYTGNYKWNGVSELVSIPLGDVIVAPRKVARIEPKTYFANERTFIQWVSASILLLSISGYLVNANYRQTAAAVSFSSFGIVIYSSALYLKRLYLLKEKQPYGYFNKVNPMFLTSVVGLTIFLIAVDSLGGEDFLRIRENSRRMLNGSVSSRRLLDGVNSCSLDTRPTFSLWLEDRPSSFWLDSKREELLMTRDDSIYMQVTNGSQKSKPFVTIKDSHLQDMIIIGERLFVVSDGPKNTELIELSRFGEKGRVVGRWTLEHGESNVNGFTFVRSNQDWPHDTGSFYINIDTTVYVYSVPPTTIDSDHSVPHRLRSLNIKALNHGHTDDNSAQVGKMTTFEGKTYILKPLDNALEVWDMTSGSFLSTIELSVETSLQTDFQLERRKSGSKLRGSDSLSDGLYLHVLSGNQLLSVPIVEGGDGNSAAWHFSGCSLQKTPLN